MSSKYFHKNYPLLYVADIVLPFCKKFMEKSTFVDFRNFFNIRIFLCCNVCKNAKIISRFFRENAKTKISVCNWSGTVEVKLCMRESVDNIKDDITMNLHKPATPCPTPLRFSLVNTKQQTCNCTLYSILSGTTKTLKIHTV
jgi:hypothetical protein